MKYEAIVKDCEQIKKIYGDVQIEIFDDYYSCVFQAKGIEFKFLVDKNELDKPYGLALKDKYNSKNVMSSIKKLREGE